MLREVKVALDDEGSVLTRMDCEGLDFELLAYSE